MIVNKCCKTIPRITIRNVVDLTGVTICCDKCDRFVVEMTLEQATIEWNKITCKTETVDIQNAITNALATSGFIKALCDKIATKVMEVQNVRKN